jgi:hypothetical protein
MLRKLGRLALVLGAALTICALPATAQSVEVHVENPGTYELESEVDLGIFAHVGGGIEVPMLSCGMDMEAIVEEEGHGAVVVNDIFPHTGSTGACDTVTACDDEPWEGQIEEDEVGGFVGHVTFCLANTGTALSGIPFAIECSMSSMEGHCDSTIVPSSEGTPTPTMPAIEVMGEGTLHESFGLMHADRR